MEFGGHSMFYFVVCGSSFISRSAFFFEVVFSGKPLVEIDKIHVS